MLNPSRADAQTKDPTITRSINFALSWGYGRLEVVNLFAYRTSKPSLLKQAAEPIGRDNDRFVLESVERSHKPTLTLKGTASHIVPLWYNGQGVSPDRRLTTTGDASASRASLRIILAWGNHGTWRQQDLYTLELVNYHS